MFKDTEAVLFDAGDTLIHVWEFKPRRFEWLCRSAGLECELPDDSEKWRKAARANELHYQQGRRRPDFRSEEFWLEGNLHALRELGLLTREGCEPEEDRLFELAVGIGRHVAVLREKGFRELPVDPEAVRVLRALRERGLRLGIASNWEGDLEEHLQEAGLLELFDVVAESHWVGHTKPDPELFRWALDRMGVQPDRAVHVGDSYEPDIHGARAAGLRGAVLLDPLDLHDELLDKYGPGPAVQHGRFSLHVIKALDELLALLPG